MGSSQYHEKNYGLPTTLLMNYCKMLSLIEIVDLWIIKKLGVLKINSL